MISAKPAATRGHVDDTEIWLEALRTADSSREHENRQLSSNSGWDANVATEILSDGLGKDFQ